MRPPLPSEKMPPPTPGDAAVDWAIRRTTGLTAQETAELLQWLGADPRNKVQLAEAEKAATFLRRLHGTRGAGLIIGELRAREEARRWRRRVIGWSASGMAAAAVLVMAFLTDGWRKGKFSAEVPGTTVVARPDRQSLPDGSVVHLNAGAEVRVGYGSVRRGIELLRGEALFTVVPDPTRPFVVTTAGVEVRAVGTEFSVRREATRVEVLVTEGRVAVAPGVPPPATSKTVDMPLAAPETLFLTAGTRISVPVADPIAEPFAPQPVSAVELAKALAWRQSRVEFSGTPLGEALVLFNAENRTQLAVGEPGIADLRIGGVFWTNDPEAFAKLLEISFGLIAERAEPNRIVLRLAR